MTPSTARRPPATDVSTGAELGRWYWRKDELVALARTHGISTGGDKATLTGRIAAHLDGIPFTEPATRRPSTAQLSEPLHPTTLIPAGQRCSQVVRAWFTAQLGLPYRFDAAMREYFARADGTTTLADALTHHRDTRASAPRAIDPAPRAIGEQFEFNRFSRAWRHLHPGAGRADLLGAWHVHRALPTEERLRWFDAAEAAGTSDRSTTNGS